MKITAVRVTNIKRIREVAISPDADVFVILIAGKNAQGKSSLLDALTLAFGGMRQAPVDPVRHGADEAGIEVELDGGALTIHRVIDAGGDSKLEVREKGSVIRSPQARLDKLVGARFLDPIAFLQLSAADQRAQLLAMFDHDGAIAKIEEHRERIYETRRNVGRDLKKAQGELARLKEMPVAEPIDVAALNEELRALTEVQQRGQRAELVLKDAAHRREQARAKLDATSAEIADLERRLADAKKRHEDELAALDSASSDLTAAKQALDVALASWTEVKDRRGAIDAELSRAGEHNRAVFEAESNNRRRRAAAETVKQIEDQIEQQTALLEKLEAQKLQILAAAKLPVDGLGVAADGITLNGVPFAQSSAAERLRVALALAMAASPGLDDVWIRDGALLDDDSLRLIAEQAEKAGKRCWVERVGDRDPGAIVIQDGQVRSARPASGVEAVA